MSLAYSELVAAVRKEGTALVTAGRVGLSDPVECCPGWDVDRLLRHVGRVFHNVANIVSDRVSERPPLPPRPEPDADAVAYCEDALEELVDALSSTPADTPVWNWSTQEQVAQFWARRMAHEAAVHRWDAQRAHGYQQRVEAELATDGVAELLDTMLPYVLSEQPAEDLAGVLGVECSDTGERWRVRLSADKAVQDEAADPDATVSGRASDVLLVLYGRLPLERVDLAGDTDLVTRWRESVRP